MGLENIDIRFQLTEEEKDRLFIGLLREWWTLAVDGLTKVAGVDTSLKVLRPYCQNMGEAGYQKLIGVTEFTAEDAPNLAFYSIGVLHVACSSGKVRFWSDEPNLAMAEISECSFNGNNKAMCSAMCELMPQYGFRGVNDEIVPEMIGSIPWGNQSCRWMISRKGFRTSEIPAKEIMMPPVKKERMNFVSMACLGEMWANATRALIDFSGPEDVSKVLLPLMYLSGNDFGNKLLDEVVEIKKGDPHFFNVIVLVNELNRRKGKYQDGGMSLDGVIEECPFSGSPPEVCLQYQAFFNGICEAIDPTYEFAYDKMMTKGDKTCHWIIRKKNEPLIEKQKELLPSDDPVKRLTNKYVDGEITGEELETKIAHLRKLGLVK